MFSEQGNDVRCGEVGVKIAVIWHVADICQHAVFTGFWLMHNASPSHSFSFPILYISFLTSNFADIVPFCLFIQLNIKYTITV